MRHVVRQRRPAEQQLDRVAATATVEPSAIVNLRFVTPVSLSVCDAPEFEAAARSGVPPVGAEPSSSVIDSAPVVELLPAASLNCAEIDFGSVGTEIARSHRQAHAAGVNIRLRDRMRTTSCASADSAEQQLDRVADRNRSNRAQS